MPLDLAIVRTPDDRTKAETKADELLAANDNTPPKKRVRFRGQPQVWNWLKKHDEEGAAEFHRND